MPRTLLEAVKVAAPTWATFSGGTGVKTGAPNHGPVTAYTGPLKVSPAVRESCAVYQTGALFGPKMKNVTKMKSSVWAKLTPQPDSTPPSAHQMSV